MKHMYIYVSCIYASFYTSVFNKHFESYQKLLKIKKKEIWTEEG